MQLAWANTVHRETGRDVLILAPLAVAETAEEGQSIGVAVTRMPETTQTFGQASRSPTTTGCTSSTFRASSGLCWTSRASSNTTRRRRCKRFSMPSMRRPKLCAGDTGPE